MKRADVETRAVAEETEKNKLESEILYQTLRIYCQLGINIHVLIGKIDNSPSGT